MVTELVSDTLWVVFSLSVSRNASDELGWDSGRRLGWKQALGKKDTASK